MVRVRLGLLAGLTLLAMPLATRAQELINCIQLPTPVPCASSGQVGNGTQGDPAWLWAGKDNDNATAFATQIATLNGEVLGLVGSANDIIVTPVGATAVFSTYPTPTRTGIWTWSPTIAANSYGNAIVLINPTSATSGNQSYSPSTQWSGFGWKTTSVAASQELDFRTEVIPAQGTTAPTGVLSWDFQINGGGFTQYMTLGSGGNLIVPNGRVIAGAFQPSGSTLSGSAFYLPAANNPGVSAGGVDAMDWLAGVTNIYNELDSVGTTFTTGTSTCGTITVTAGGPEAGTFTVQNTGAGCQVTVLFVHASAAGKRCSGSDETHPAGWIQIAHGVQSCTMQGAATAGDTIVWGLDRGF